MCSLGSDKNSGLYIILSRIICTTINSALLTVYSLWVPAKAKSQTAPAGDERKNQTITRIVVEIKFGLFKQNTFGGTMTVFSRL